jgi:hypothetical protein
MGKCGYAKRSLTASRTRTLNSTSSDVLKGVFSRQLQRRKPIYDEVMQSNPESAARMRGEDLAKWQDDPIVDARQVCSMNHSANWKASS